MMSSATRNLSLGNNINNRDDEFIAGMQLALNRLNGPVSDDLSCDKNKCDEVSAFAYRYGEWVGLSLSACINPEGIAPAFWTAQVQAYRTLLQNAPIATKRSTTAYKPDWVCEQAKRSFLQYHNELL
jgi:hypothetical protein